MSDPVPDDITRVLTDPAHQMSNLLAATVGFFALTGFAAYEHAYLAYAVYCSTLLTLFLPKPLHRIGQITVFTAFAISLIGGSWGTAAMIAAITCLRYVSGYVALRTDRAARAATDAYIGREEP